ncbi:MAG: GNAT family N-acetyltransferase [Anaerolineales bacterium]|nr:GNAT family N-acetyltransferase [Anaerolineales bacterium]
MATDAQPDPASLTLKDGTPVWVRPIRPDDAERLQAFHAQLSPESIYLRWLSAHPVLSLAEAQALATVDYASRMALVATVSPAPEAELIGVARYGRVPGRPDEAEVAVVVADNYQRRGLGTALLQRLMWHAHRQGYRYWTAEINVANARMMKFIQRGGLPILKKYAGGSWQVRVELGAPPDEAAPAA